MPQFSHYKQHPEHYILSPRNSVLGACSTIARIGGISAPWIAVYLPDQVTTCPQHRAGHVLLSSDHQIVTFPSLRQGSFSASMPLYIFGSSSLVAGLAALFLLTETLGSPLPDDFEDVQQMKKDAKPIWSVVISKYGPHHPPSSGSASGLNGMSRQRKMKRRGRRRKTRRRRRRK